MNRLKKKAIQDFVGLCVFVIVTVPFFIFFTVRNVQGFDYILIWVIVGVPTGLLAYLYENRQLKQFDERQRALYQKALQLSYGVFIFYTLGFAIVAFFLAGGGAMIPVWLMPMMLFSGVFIAGTTSSFILFKQCDEEGNE